MNFVTFCGLTTRVSVSTARPEDCFAVVLIHKGMTSTISSHFSRLNKRPHPSAISDTDIDIPRKLRQDKKRPHIADSLEEEDENKTMQASLDAISKQLDAFTTKDDICPMKNELQLRHVWTKLRNVRAGFLKKRREMITWRRR